MPVNMAVKEPRAGVIRNEAEGDVVATTPNTEDVAARRVHIVVGGTASGADNVESVLKDDCISSGSYLRKLRLLTPCKWKGCYHELLAKFNLLNIALTFPPPGIEISMVLFGGRL